MEVSEGKQRIVEVKGDLPLANLEVLRQCKECQV